jgi:uncharacterized RDD family membrane protein YckC
VNPPENASGARRLAAFLVDYGAIAAYIALLAGISIATSSWRGPALEGPGPTTLDRLRAQALGFLTLTLPVVSYFALMESSNRGATLGKRALRLRVVGTDDRRISVARSFFRSALKFAPWELAHTALWQIPGRPFRDPPGVANWAGLVAAAVLALVWVGSLFVGRWRTPYDRAAGTRVVAAPGTSTASTDRAEATIR